MKPKNTTGNEEVGCDDCVVVAGENPSVMEIQFCPLHAAAGELLEALKALSSGIPDGLPVKEATNLRNKQYENARAAIAKATEGR